MERCGTAIKWENMGHQSCIEVSASEKLFLVGLCRGLREICLIY